MTGSELDLADLLEKARAARNAWGWSSCCVAVGSPDCRCKLQVRIDVDQAEQLVKEVERLRATVARVVDVVDADVLARAECHEVGMDEECGCSYKDCYECGKWHNCTHGPLVAVRDALDAATAEPAPESTPDAARGSEGFRGTGVEVVVEMEDE